MFRLARPFLRPAYRCVSTCNFIGQQTLATIRSDDFSLGVIRHRRYGSSNSTATMKENEHTTVISLQGWRKRPDPAVFKDWYTTSNPPLYWSCNWAAWDGMEMWLPYWDACKWCDIDMILPCNLSDAMEPEGPDPDLLAVHVGFNGPFRLPAPIEPIIYYDPDGDGHFDAFAFRCGEQTYYYYDHESSTVRRYHGKYPSPVAFLSAHMDSFGVEPPKSRRLLE
ncbi:hypothetical protein GGX14DRAFT_459612, partial [Mycena pura]